MSPNKNYIVVESPTGDTIRFDFRPDCNLVIFTNFNPIRKLAFIDVMESYKSIECVTSTHRYDGNIGSIVVKLMPFCNTQTVIENVTDAFQKEFGTMQTKTKLEK